MRVEPFLSDVSPARARAGPVERQGSRVAQEYGSTGVEGKDLPKAPVTPPLRPEDISASRHKEQPVFSVSGKEKEEIRTEETVEPIINGLRVRLEFAQDEATEERVIKLYDTESGELIRQIPPEDTSAFLSELESRKGVLVSIRL